jgi:hypothetical protein
MLTRRPWSWFSSRITFVMLICSSGATGLGRLGPSPFWRDDVPRTELEPVDPGARLPGGLVALHDGRGRSETPVWLPEQRTLVFADAAREFEGELRIWDTAWYAERTLPAMQALLDLPFEHVVVSHGDPIHDRSALRARPEACSVLECSAGCGDRILTSALPG